MVLRGVVSGWVIFAVIAAFYVSEVEAGLFLTEIRVDKNIPACISLHAGGVTGPGSGVTIYNQCEKNIILNGFFFGSVPFARTNSDDVAAYLVDTSGAYRDIVISAGKGESCKYSTLPIAENSKNLGACGTLNSPPCSPEHFIVPRPPFCKTLVLQPKESALIFVSDYFVFSGEDGVLLEGKSFEVK